MFNWYFSLISLCKENNLLKFDFDMLVKTLTLTKNYPIWITQEKNTLSLKIDNFSKETRTQLLNCNKLKIILKLNQWKGWKVS